MICFCAANVLFCSQQTLPCVELPVAQSAFGWGSGDPCEGKEYCLTVYLTPWCPACKSSVTFINELREYFSDNNQFALQVIVGADGEANLEQMAKQIGKLVYIDADAKFRRATGVHAYPTWLLTDKNRKIIKMYKRGAPYGGTTESRIKFFFEKELDFKLSRLSRGQ